MEGLPMVSYLTGTMNSLVDKLAQMKIHSNSTKEFSEFKEAVLRLKEDFFDKHAVPDVCMKQFRELVFEVEDWIDQKKLETEDIEKFMTEDIEKFMTEIKEARERFIWYYDLLKININPRRLLVEEKPCHGLFDGPRDELVKHLTDKKEMLKVVYVVGREGIGKTTLAKEIYSELQLRGQFEFQAFVSVGQRRPMREILNDILRQVKPGSKDLLEVPGVTTELREYLDKKRYFILVDGIWSTLAWKVITCALPNNYGSRVMTTTCIIDVANSCSRYPNDLVYQLEALNKDNSTILFLSKTITIEEEEKWAGFEDDSCYLLKMCGGLPLAIIVAAGLLLARNSEAPEELIMLRESIYSPLKQYSTSDGMTKILHMSFADLSLPARSCFMYLRVFREFETIMKDRLIRLWGAEVFIPKRDKECWWVTGERYFNELMSRRLIQPVFTFDDDQTVGCTVHTVILDFIRSISREENFATRATELNTGPFPCDTIRRFSLDCGIEDGAVPLSTSSMHLSSMRSLTVFGDVTGKIYPPDSPADEERIPHPQRLSSVSTSVWHGKEMHADTAFGARMWQQLSRMRPRRGVIKDDEEKHDPLDSRAADERISDPEGLPSDSKQGEEMHATEAPGVGMMDQPSRDVEGIQGNSPAADERISVLHCMDLLG